MKHITRALSLAALVCATLTQAGHLDNSGYQFNVGPTFNYARFKVGEVVPGSTDYVAKATGYMAGVHADFTYEHACHVFARVRFDGRWNAGDISRFQYNLNNTETAGRFKVSDYRPEFNIGYTFGLGDCNNVELTPYTGVGGIILQTQRRDTRVTPLVLNPRERRTDIFVPVGLEVDWLRDSFDVGVNAEYRIGVQGRYQLRNRDGVVNPDSIKTGRTNSFLVEVPLTWHQETCRCFDWQMKVVPLFDWTRWGNRRDGDVTPANSLKLQQFYLGLHVDFGVSF